MRSETPNDGLHARFPAADAVAAVIRRARPADAVELSRLAGELGYPLAVAEMARRLGVLLPDRRRGGLGRALVGVAEAWTHARGIPSLTVRSNAARAESHPFYEALGYARAKTQHVYSKLVAGADDAAARALALLETEAWP
jgi:GNAT superfamily N-acetyltransferase